MFHRNSNTPAAEVSLTSGLYYCFACHESYSLPRLVMTIGKMSFFEALRLIGEPSDIIDLTEPEPQPTYDSSELVKFHNAVWGRGSAYLNKRKVNNQTITTMELGYSDEYDMIIIPVHDILGKTLGYVGRSIEGKRFKNSTHLPRSSTLFNIHRVWTSNTVHVVESALDAIRLHQAGIPAVASLGSSIANSQIDLLKRSFDEITVIPDQDMAGFEMARKIKSMIHDVEIIKLKDIGVYEDDAALTAAVESARLVLQR